MRLYFDGKTNDRMMYVNYAIFVDAAGTVYEIDRESTYWDYDEENNTYSACWRGVYLWDGENENFLTEDFFSDKQFVEFVIEDDTPVESECGNEYYITVDEWGID